MWVPVTLYLLTLSVVDGNNPKITSRLQERLDKGEKVGVLVSFDGVDEICVFQEPESRSSAEASPDRGQQLSKLKEKLIAKMESSQSGVTQRLSTRAGGHAPGYHQFWISNQMLVSEATPDLIQEIAEDPKVSRIQEEPKMQLLENKVERTSSADVNLGAPQSNLIQTKVPEAWAEMGDNHGYGIVIGFIDTGVHYTHEIFKGKFLGEYGWYDHRTKSTHPFDLNGHGSHVTGLAVGGLGIGVAPGAQFATCRVCAPGPDGQPDCQIAEAFYCAQFFTCPTLLNGTNHDCSKAPHIINNSWGFPDEYGDYYEPMVKCWHAAGIIPVFAIGNTGANETCNSAQYPGVRADVITVGNIGKDDHFSNTSSRGPTKAGLIKPDLVAPGEYVVSAGITGDSDYQDRYVGTSQAAPQVSGAIALLLSKNKHLSFEQIRVKLLASVDAVVIPHAPDCGGVKSHVFPNNVVGFGRLNVQKLLQLA